MKFLLFVICLGSICFAHAETFRVYELQVTQEKMEDLGLTWGLEGPMQGSFMGAADQAHRLLEALGESSVTVNQYAELKPDGEGKWSIDQTHTITYEVKSDLETPQMQEKSTIVGLKASATEDNGGYQLTYYHAWLEQWLYYQHRLIPIVATRECNSRVLFDDSIIIGGITSNGVNTVIIFQIVPEQ